MRILSRFWRSTSGATAIIMAVLSVPVMMAVGLALDHMRVQASRTILQSAVDSAVISAVRAATSNDDTTRATWTTIARRAFDANYDADRNGEIIGFAPEISETAVKITATARPALVFGALFESTDTQIQAIAEAPIGLSRLEVALVLDNTGSMAQLNKMTELKAAATSFIDIMKTAVETSPGEVHIGLVPFGTQVRLSTAYAGQYWMRFDPGSSEPALQVSSAAWAGCVADRDQPNNARTTKPIVGGDPTLYPAANCSATLATVTPVTTDFTGLKTAIANMTPNGTTNTTIGLNWGFNLLSPQNPLGEATRPFSDPYDRKVIVLLTDGLNTQDRFGNVSSTIDATMRTLCGEVKKNKITVYTIRLIEGNETLLRDCATDPSKYFSVAAAAELKTIFTQIAADLIRVRLSK